jgi:hypothetical protein
MPQAETPRTRKAAEAKTQKADTQPTASPPVGLQPKKTGRPSKYTPEIAQQMCELLSEGVPLREICRKNGFPEWRTVYDWMYRDDQAVASGGGVGLSAAIARAREAGYDAMAEECLIIADTPKFGQKQVMTEDGTATTLEDMLGHRKLQIETRLKLLAKWNPKKYGDRTTLAGDAEAPIKIEAESQAEKMLAALLTNVELKRQSESR